MAHFTRHKIDTEEERRLVTGLIVSDRICKEVLPLVEDDYFQNPYSSIIVGWVRKYWDKYNSAPGKHIQDIYETERRNLLGDRAELVGLFMERLSQEYEQENLNEPYLIDKAIDYLEERSLLVLSDKMRTYTEMGEKAKAKGLLTDYRKVAKTMSTWINPLSMQEVNSAMDVEKDVLFKMPGALGRLLGPFERGSFITVMAPVKKTKTWIIQELGIIALTDKLKVAFISLEMKKEKMERRIYKRLISAVDGGGEVLYPIFDCLSNQDGSCKKGERLGEGNLFDSDGNIKLFDPDVDWKPCDVCKGKTKDFVSSATHWYIPIVRPSFDIKIVRESMRSMQHQLGDNLRLLCYPRFSANLSDIRRDLDILEYTEGFIPDVIIIDYADILKPERETDDTLQSVNETWMSLAQLADVRRCLLVTATQSNKEAWDAKNTKAKNVSQYFMKFAHVEMAFMLSQTPEEKKRNLIRCSVAVSRNEDFNENYQVKILQQLSVGQPLLDSEYEHF